MTKAKKGKLEEQQGQANDDEKLRDEKEEEGEEMEQQREEKDEENAKEGKEGKERKTQEARRRKLEACGRWKGGKC